MKHTASLFGMSTTSIQSLPRIYVHFRISCLFTHRTFGFVAQKHFNFADPTNQLTRALDSVDALQFQKILEDSLMQLALRPGFLLQCNDDGFQ